MSQKRGDVLALHRTWTGHTQGAPGATDKATFGRELRVALRYLYDPATLSRSPLLILFGLKDEQDPLEALRRLLVEAIEALKPAPGTPSQANAWRLYQILYERYVEQFSQDEVAIHLAVGTRQLRRQESRARRVLADHLWAQYNLQDQKGDSLPPTANLVTPSREQELEWLRRSYPTEHASVAEVIRPVLKAVAPLLEALGTTMACTLPEGLPRLVVQMTTLRQALSNVITAAVHSVPRGQVQVGAEASGREVVVEVRTLAGAPAAYPRPGARSAPNLTQDDLDNLQLAQTMVGFSGGSLEVTTFPFGARVVLPAVREIGVLVVDDNADTLCLLERYLADTRYRFTGTADPEQVLALAVETAPQIIVIDVMLPGVDGWELLGRLREHPRTRGVPIVVCTILAQEQLALTLGASAFLRKPVGREAFLAVLNQVSASL